MDPAQLIPAPDALPVAWPWFKALLIPCVALHLLFMNALLGTVIIGWTRIFRSQGHGFETARGISKTLPFHMAFTINLGVAALLFMQVLYGHLFYTSSILMGVWWLSTLALVLAAYGATYWIDFKFQAPGLGPRLIWTLLLAALLAVAFVFVNNLTLTQAPASWPRYFENPRGTLWHWDDATLIPRYLHFVAASAAVGGLVIALLNRHGPADRTSGGMRWFTGATALQLIIGGWFFVTLPPAVRSALMGGDMRATAIFAAAVLGFLLALAFGIRQSLWPSVGATVLTVLAMVLLRDTVRVIYLAPYFRPEDLPVRPQLAPMGVFALFLALGLAAVGYMVRLYINAKGAAAE